MSSQEGRDASSTKIVAKHEKTRFRSRPPSPFAFAGDAYIAAPYDGVRDCTCALS
jgi:hypothetical protein